VVERKSGHAIRGKWVLLTSPSPFTTPEPKFFLWAISKDRETRMKTWNGDPLPAATAETLRKKFNPNIHRHIVVRPASYRSHGTMIRETWSSVTYDLKGTR
jgi:hypothetical protein